MGIMITCKTFPQSVILPFKSNRIKQKFLVLSELAYVNNRAAKFQSGDAWRNQRHKSIGNCDIAARSFLGSLSADDYDPFIEVNIFGGQSFHFLASNATEQTERNPRQQAEFIGVCQQCFCLFRSKKSRERK